MFTILQLINQLINHNKVPKKFASLSYKQTDQYIILKNTSSLHFTHFMAGPITFSAVGQINNDPISAIKICQNRV